MKMRQYPRTRLCLTVLALFLPAVAMAADFYRYTNDQGVIVVDDHVPPEHVKKGYEVVNEKGVVKIVASKGGRPRGTKYVLVKNTSDPSMFDGNNSVVAGLELEQRDGYVRVIEAPASGFFSKVRMNRNDCIWSIDGVAVTDLSQLRHELKEASGKIVFILMYNSFRKLRTTVMANVAIQTKGAEKWKLLMRSMKDQPDRLEDQYDIHQKVRLLCYVFNDINDH